MSSNLAAFLLVAGVSAAPARKQLPLQTEPEMFSTLSASDYSGAPGCWDSWQAFNEARCWCHSGCALDCSQGGVPGIKGETTNEAWCSGQQESLQFCEPLIDNMTASCLAYMDDQIKAPGLSNVCTTANVSKDLYPNCGAKWLQRIVGSEIRFQSTVSKAWVTEAMAKISPKPEECGTLSCFDTFTPDKRADFKVIDAGDGMVALYNTECGRFLRMNPSKLEQRNNIPIDMSDAVSEDALNPDWKWERFQIVETGKWLEPTMDTRGRYPALEGKLYPEIAIYNPDAQRYVEIYSYLGGENNPYEGCYDPVASNTTIITDSHTMFSNGDSSRFLGHPTDF